MPVYQYQCKVHGPFEIKQGMHMEHIASCPVCYEAMDRVFFPNIFYFPDCLWHSDGSKQSPDELPMVPKGRGKYFEGGF